MPVRLTCTECKATLKVRDDLAGKKVKCPRCAHVLIVPTPEEEDVPTLAPVADPPASRKSRPVRDEEDEDEDRDRGKKRKRDPDEEEDDRPSKRSSGIRKARDEEDRPSKRSSAIRKDRDRDEEEEEDRDRKRSAIRKGRDRDRDDEDEEEDRDRGDERQGRKSKYKPCPHCGARGAQKVLWTAWGSFYGPAMFNHVRCPKCSYCYNGKSGRSNLIPAIIFFSVPLIGILAIIGALVYIVFMRGYIK